MKKLVLFLLFLSGITLYAQHRSPPQYVEDWKTEKYEAYKDEVTRARHKGVYETTKRMAGKAWDHIRSAAGTDKNTWKQRNTSGGRSGIRGFGEMQTIWAGKWEKVDRFELGMAEGIACDSHPDSGSFRLILTEGDSTANGTINIGDLEILVSGAITNITGETEAASTKAIISRWQVLDESDSITGNFNLFYVPEDNSIGALEVLMVLEKVTN